MRIAVSTPARWATLLAAVTTLVLAVGQTAQRDRAATAVVHSDRDLTRLARADLSQIERQLDALTDRVTSAMDELQAAETASDGHIAAVKLARLRVEIADKREHLLARARQVRATLAR